MNCLLRKEIYTKDYDQHKQKERKVGRNKKNDSRKIEKGKKVRKEKLGMEKQEEGKIKQGKNW